MKNEYGAAIPVGLFGLAGLALFSAIVSVTSWLLAAEGAGGAAIPLTSGATATAAVGTVIWVARKMIAGEVVPLPVKELLDASREQSEKIARLAEWTEARETEMSQQALVREQQLRELVKSATEALFAVNELVRHAGGVEQRKE